MNVTENAAAIGNIGFPEFTTKLVNDTFNTLLSNQARQQEAFLELTDEVAKTLTEYINDTQDDVTGDEVLAFITSLVPSVDNEALNSEDETEEPLTDASTDEIDALNNAVIISQDEVDDLSLDASADTSLVGNGGLTTSSTKSAIVQAIINRLSVNKYQFLREIVQQGLVRLVVEDGMIETSLNFASSEFRSLRASSSSYGVRSSRFGISGSGSFFSKALRINAGANFSRLNVNTSTSDVINNSSEQVTISGRVKINFASDFQELANV